MAAHRFWRLFCSQSTGRECAISVFELRETAAGPTVTTDPFASDGNSFAPGGYGYWRAFDHSNLSDGWCSNNWARPNDPAWIIYDFRDTPRDIVEVLVRSFPEAWGPECAPSVFRIEYSDDGASWADANFDIPTQSGWGVGESRTFNAASAPPIAAVRNYQLARIAVTGELPPPIKASQLARIAVIGGTVGRLQLGPAVKLNCWQPCTAFGREQKQ